jgi:hypothetical protein
VQDGPTQYELLSNEVTFPIETHPYFVDETPVLTADEMLAVQVAVVNGVTGSTFNTKQTALYNFYVQGVDYFFRSAYVLRASQVCSKRSEVAASYENVNEVAAPPDTAQVNTLIGELPTGEWLKKAPQVRMYGNKKWQISQEWWWAPKWSKILYGGTGTP